MRVNLVLEGGGVLGISFVGAYQALKDNGFEVVRCAGTSAGSIISSLIIAGYKPEELTEILKQTDFKQFLKKTNLSRVFLLGKVLSLLINEGSYNSSCIESWMEKLLSDKGISTFDDIMIDNESPLKIIAADITDRKMLILPDDLTYYGYNPKDFKIAKAVRMSCTIPFFYTPVLLKKDGVTHYIVDGGLLSTFPIWIFDVDTKPNRPTIGLKIKDKDSLTSLGKRSFFAYLQDLITACINMDEMTYVRRKDLVRTIIIDNKNQLKSTDFKLSDEDIDTLYDSGYQAVSQFKKRWSYVDYISRYMM